MIFIAKVLKQPALGKNDCLELCCHIETFKIAIWFCITMLFITAFVFIDLVLSVIWINQA